MFRRIFSYPSLALGASESIGSPLTDNYWLLPYPSTRSLTMRTAEHGRAFQRST